MAGRSLGAGKEEERTLERTLRSGISQGFLDEGLGFKECRNLELRLTRSVSCLDTIRRCSRLEVCAEFPLQEPQLISTQAMTQHQHAPYG